MKYINIEELTSLIKLNIVNDLSEDNYKLLDQLELYSYSEIDANIGFKFDTDAGLRSNNQFLKMILIDILIYHFECRISHTSIDIIREERYKKATDWLRDVAIGKIVPNIPIKQSELEYVSTNIYTTNPYKLTSPY